LERKKRGGRLVLTGPPNPRWGKVKGVMLSILSVADRADLEKGKRAGKGK